MLGALKRGTQAIGLAPGGGELGARLLRARQRQRRLRALALGRGASFPLEATSQGRGRQRLVPLSLEGARVVAVALEPLDELVQPPRLGLRLLEVAGRRLRRRPGRLHRLPQPPSLGPRLRQLLLEPQLLAAQRGHGRRDGRLARGLLALRDAPRHLRDGRRRSRCRLARRGLHLLARGRPHRRPVGTQRSERGGGTAHAVAHASIAPARGVGGARLRRAQLLQCLVARCPSFVEQVLKLCAAAPLALSLRQCSISLEAGTRRGRVRRCQLISQALPLRLRLQPQVIQSLFQLRNPCLRLSTLLALPLEELGQLGYCVVFGPRWGLVGRIGVDLVVRVPHSMRPVLVWLCTRAARPATASSIFVATITNGS